MGKLSIGVKSSSLSHLLTSLLYQLMYEVGASRVRGSTLISLRQRHGFSDCFIPPPGVRVKA